MDETEPIFGKWYPYDKSHDFLHQFDKKYFDHCLVYFDNGDVLRYEEDFPFAMATHILFYPAPPK